MDLKRFQVGPFLGKEILPPVGTDQVGAMETELTEGDVASEEIVHDLVLELNPIANLELLELGASLKDLDQVIRAQLGGSVDAENLRIRPREKGQCGGLQEATLGNEAGNLVDDMRGQLTQVFGEMDILGQHLDAEAHQVLGSTVVRSVHEAVLDSTTSSDAASRLASLLLGRTILLLGFLAALGTEQAAVGTRARVRGDGKTLLASIAVINLARHGGRALLEQSPSNFVEIVVITGVLVASLEGLGCFDLLNGLLLLLFPLLLFGLGLVTASTACGGRRWASLDNLLRRFCGSHIGSLSCIWGLITILFVRSVSGGRGSGSSSSTLVCILPDLVG